MGGLHAHHTPLTPPSCPCARDALSLALHPAAVRRRRAHRLSHANAPDLAIRGTLHSVDQYLNIKLLGVSVEDTTTHPHMQSVKNCFIRGSVIKYVQLPASEVDTELLQDATRREAAQQKEKAGGR